VPLPPKKASSDRGKKQMEMGGGCGGAGRRRRRTLTRAGLHSTTVACVPQQPRRMGIVVGAGPAGIPSAGGSDRIGSELLLHALLGGAARRTAPVLACQWRVGRRAPTRRCVVRSSTGMHACMQKRAVDPMLRPRCAEGQGTGGRSLSVSASASPSSCMDDY
jgi:hypothetical protein